MLKTQAYNKQQTNKQKVQNKQLADPTKRFNSFSKAENRNGDIFINENLKIDSYHGFGSSLLFIDLHV